MSIPYTILSVLHVVETLRVTVRIVLKCIAADEINVLSKLLHSVVLVEINLGHHRRQVHWVRYDLTVVWHLSTTHNTQPPLRHSVTCYKAIYVSIMLNYNRKIDNRKFFSLLFSFVHSGLSNFNMNGIRVAR